MFRYLQGVPDERVSGSLSLLPLGIVKKKMVFSMSSPIKKGPGTYGPAAFHGEQKKTAGHLGSAPAVLIYCIILYRHQWTQLPVGAAPPPIHFV